jgi:NADH-ubiquinone oxidoreductase chain 6
MLAESSHINTLGNILYTSFPLLVLLTSLILLLAMVGAIVITLKN